ncbi:MAG: HD domain-containing protein [Gemmataceae bacterium]
MATLEKALEIAAAAHAGQKDKQGKPYLTHPLSVMGRVDDEQAQIVAVLHDVVEDTDVTADDIRRAGFSAAILDALALVTHDKQQPYADYVVACKGNPTARQVKLADLAENHRLERAILRPATVERDLARMNRYLFSYKFLTDQLSEADYRDLMARFG